MARFKYFCDLPSGTTLELISAHIGHTKDGKMPANDYDRAVKQYGGSWVGLDNDGFFWPITRKIEMKSRPSRHECDARCMNGKCNGACECRCGGANHGKGRIKF